MPRKVAKEEECREVASAPKPARRASVGSATPLVRTESRTIQRAPRSRAIEIILADALADGEGFTFGAVGSPRFGKTYFTKELLTVAATKGLADYVLIHDVKKPGVLQYEGAPCASLDEFLGSGERYATERAIVFNGQDWRRQPTLQEVCEVALAVHEVAKEGGEGLVVVADEVFKGTNGFAQFTPGPKVNGEPSPALFPLFLREGTSQKISTCWTTQIPQQLPTECKVLTRCVAQFHLESLAADAASDKFRLDADGPAVLRTLQRGEFVLFCQGREWDRTIYS